MAIEVTDEMRKAVLEEMCETQGHQTGLSNMFTTPVGTHAPHIGNDDPDLLPHVFCARCGKVWLVMEDPGEDYEAAEAALLDQLKVNTVLSKWVRERKDRRGSA